MQQTPEKKLTNIKQNTLLHPKSKKCCKNIKSHKKIHYLCECAECTFH